MPLWSANDDPTGKPKWLSKEFTNGSTPSNNLTYGVSRVEVQAASQKGADFSPGWVKVRYGTGGVSITLTAGGSAYTNADSITVDANGTVGAVNATANVIVGFGANVSGTTMAITTGQSNGTATGTANLLNVFANGDQIFVYTNSTFADTKLINKVVNSSFLNITSTWAQTNATGTFGVSGIIQSIVMTNTGSGFTNTSNLTVTTTSGHNAGLTIGLTGLAGRVYRDTIVVMAGDITNDAADNAVFPNT